MHMENKSDDVLYIRVHLDTNLSLYTYIGVLENGF